MFAYLNRKLGNISVAAKLALGFAVVLLLTLATTISGWRAWMTPSCAHSNSAK